jgi:hypothetical protein
MPNFRYLIIATLLFLSSHSYAENSEHGHMGMMPAMYGDYSMMREASGTAWQPESSPMRGGSYTLEDWSLMAQGYVNGIYNHQGGKRGDSKFISTNMAMLMGARSLGPGIVGFRSMLSLEPLMGKTGYPELLQTGETADGENHLIDRQHPHDLFMELAITYSLPLTKELSIFFYGGLPGEPALGPPAFMHRLSGIDIPDAPITHHWLDSTHITEGVITSGITHNNWKIEGSVFNGREPDQHRYNIETRSLDSWSTRVTYNPTDNWSAQLSYGYLNSPEGLSPEVSVRRTTASLSYNLPFDNNNWATTLAWGHNKNSPGNTLDGIFLNLK